MTELMRDPNPATTGTEIIALAYKRASTEEQLKGYGLDVQDDELRTWEAEDTKRTILEVFSDEGVSGSLDRRPAMLRLEERALEGRANRIVVPNVDRVGRTARAAFNWAWRMQDIGIHFISVEERIDTSTELGWTMFQQYVFFSETEWNRIRRRTLDGRNKKIEYGGWPGGPAPYGYRIEGKGRKGSFLVVCEGEARVILKAVALLVDDKKSYEDVAEELNRLEMYTRSGKPWTATNLYQRMHSETFDGYTTYRKANRGRRKKATRLHEDGTPVHGEPVRIAVSQILTSDRAEELKAVLKKRSINKPRKPAAIYPLSGHIASDCGQVYIGGGRTGQRAYRCQGNNSGKSGCGCTNLDATEIENAVWSKVTELLADEGRLRALADREIVSLPGDRDKYLERQERLAARIEKQEKLIEDSVPEYIKAGMEPAVAAAAVRKLLEELESWKKQLGEVQHWLSEYEQTRARANAIVSLAHSSQERLANLDAADKAGIFDMFRIAVLPEKGRFVKRPGAPCTVTAWHHETGTLVPPEVSETQWKTAREVIAQYHGPRHFSMTELDLRQALNGMLHRLRHGAAWTEIEFWGHSEAIRQRQGVWFRSGAWQALMEYLTTDERGTVAYRHPTIPLLHVVSEIRSGVGTFREVAIDAEKIAKAVVGVGADRLSRLPLA